MLKRKKNKTRLTKREELIFQKWRMSLPDNLQKDSDLFDLRGAWKAKLNPIIGDDGLYHFESRDPETGVILKSPDHPTYDETIKSELELGYTPTIDVKSGRTVSKKIRQHGGRVDDKKKKRSLVDPARVDATDYTRYLNKPDNSNVFKFLYDIIDTGAQSIRKTGRTLVSDAAGTVNRGVSLRREERAKPVDLLNTLLAIPDVTDIASIAGGAAALGAAGATALTKNPVRRSILRSRLGKPVREKIYDAALSTKGSPGADFISLSKYLNVDASKSKFLKKYFDGLHVPVESYIPPFKKIDNLEEFSPEFREVLSKNLPKKEKNIEIVTIPEKELGKEELNRAFLSKSKQDLKYSLPYGVDPGGFYLKYNDDVAEAFDVYDFGPDYIKSISRGNPGFQPEEIQDMIQKKFPNLYDRFGFRKTSEILARTANRMSIDLLDDAGKPFVWVQKIPAVEQKKQTVSYIDRSGDMKNKKKYPTGGQIGGLLGGLAGQMLIPIPGVGGTLGAIVGSQLLSTLDKKDNSFNNPLSYSPDVKPIPVAYGYARGGVLDDDKKSIVQKGTPMSLGEVIVSAKKPSLRKSFKSPELLPVSRDVSSLASRLRGTIQTPGLSTTIYLSPTHSLDESKLPKELLRSNFITELPTVKEEPTVVRSAGVFSDIDLNKLPDVSSSKFKEYNVKLKNLYGKRAKPYFVQNLKSNSRIQNAVSNYAGKHGLDPSIIYSTAMEEGLDKFIDEVNRGISNYDNISTFGYFGLDTVVDEIPRLVKKGYLDPSIVNKVRKKGRISNESGEKYTWANVDLETGMDMVGAALRDRNDRLKMDAEKIGVKLTPEWEKFFTFVYYNAANPKKMLESYARKGFLKDEKFIRNKGDNYWNDPHEYALRRMTNAQMLQDLDIFDLKETNEQSLGTKKLGGKIPMKPRRKKILAYGGVARRIRGSDAKEFIGRSHEQGGIDIGDDIEVEGGETMDYLKLKGGKAYRKGGVPYIFSDRLNIPGKNLSFADAHKILVKKGASESEIVGLANIQEKVAGRKDRFSYGGNTKRKYQLGGWGMGHSGNNTPLQEPLEEGPSTFDKMLPYAPLLLNTALGVSGLLDKKVPPATQVNTRAEGTLRALPTTFDVNPALGAIRGQTLALQRSPGSTPTTRLAAHSAALQASNDLYSRKHNLETEANLQRGTALANVQQNLAGQQARYDAIRREEKYYTPGVGDYISQGLTDVASMFQQNRFAKHDESALVVQLGSMDPVNRDQMLDLLSVTNPALANKLRRALKKPK